MPRLITSMDYPATISSRFCEGCGFNQSVPDTIRIKSKDDTKDDIGKKTEKKTDEHSCG